MAVRIMVKVQPGGTSVLKNYTIHEEQIACIARELKERSCTRRPDSLPPDRFGWGTVKQKGGKTGSALPPQIRKTIWETSPVGGFEADGSDDLLPIMEPPKKTVTAVRCYRCGIHFPVADFHYTKKSGLCIDCWEEVVL